MHYSQLEACFLPLNIIHYIGIRVLNLSLFLPTEGTADITPSGASDPSRDPSVPPKEVPPNADQAIQAEEIQEAEAREDKEEKAVEEPTAEGRSDMVTTSNKNIP